uniref:Uncharacterized protein n=1 Tax=Cacopsylla melanoneura TaxID=428564 RepID=A0A8D9EL63_9HEMI
MRKTVMSVLYTLFEPTKKTMTPSEHATCNCCGWGLPSTQSRLAERHTPVSSICDGYIRYIRKNYPSQNHTVVFDGYFLMSTKAEEQKRRYRLKKSIDIHLYQTRGLSNPKNKHQLITLLMSRMQEKDISTHQSE